MSQWQKKKLGIKVNAKFTKENVCLEFDALSQWAIQHKIEMIQKKAPKWAK